MAAATNRANGGFGIGLLVLLWLDAPQTSGFVRTGLDVAGGLVRPAEVGSRQLQPLLAFSQAGGTLQGTRGNRFGATCGLRGQGTMAADHAGLLKVRCQAGNLVATESRSAADQASSTSGAASGNAKPRRGRGIGKGLAIGKSPAWIEEETATQEAVRRGIQHVQDTGYFASVGLPQTIDGSPEKQGGSKASAKQEGVKVTTKPGGTKTKSRGPKSPSNRPRRGIGSKVQTRDTEKQDSSEGTLTDPVAFAEIDIEHSETFYEEIETEWTQEKEALKASARHSSRPPGARWRSRARNSALRNTRTPRSGGGSELESMMKNTHLVSKGANQKSRFDQLFFNPGFLELRRQANEREASRSGGAGSLALVDLKKRGLLDPESNSGDIRRSLVNIAREIHVKMAIFDMKVLGNTLFSAGSDDKISVWDTETWTETRKLEGHSGWINALLVDEKSGRLCSASEDGTVKIWDLNTWECITTLKGHQGGALSIELTDNHLYVGCANKILVWSTADWTVQHKFTNHTHVLRAMSKGQQLSKNRPLDPALAMAREPSKLFGRKIHGIQFCKPYMFAAVDDGTIWVWNTKNMEVERKLLGPAQKGTWVRPIRVASFADPKTGKPRLKLISGWADGAVRIYDLKTWKLEHTLAAHSGPVLSLDVQGDRVISAGADMAANEWDSKTWTLVRALRGHNGAVCAVSTAQQQVVTASLDGFMKVWSSD